MDVRNIFTKQVSWCLMACLYSVLGMNWIVVFREVGVLSMNFPLNIRLWWWLGIVCLFDTGPRLWENIALGIEAEALWQRGNVYWINGKTPERNGCLEFHTLSLLPTHKNMVSNNKHLLQTMGRDMPSFQNIVSKFLEEEIKYVFFFKSHKSMLYLWYTNDIFIIKLALFIDFILKCNTLNETPHPKVRCLRNTEGIYSLLVAGVHGLVSNIFTKQSSTFHLYKNINLAENFETLF